MIISLKGNGGTPGPTPSAGVSSVNGKTGAVKLSSINGFDLTKETEITIEGGSGDYSVVTELPEATKEGQMVYLSEDMTHEEQVTGVGGNFYQFGETGEGEYHIIQYGDADVKIYRDGDGNIIRVWSREQDLPFSFDRTWYKLDKSFTGHKDAFYMFDSDQNFWFYVYEGEEFADNNYGGQTWAAGETCDYVDTIVDYKKGQYIVKDVDGTLSWEKYDFPAKVFVYDGKADHSDIANAVKPYFEALRAGGADAVNQMPHIYTIIYNGVPFSGFRSEGDDDHLVLYSSVMVELASSIGTHKLYVWENGVCEWQDTGMHIENPVYVSKEGFEGFDNATKITFKFNDGFEWGNVLAGKVYIDGWDRDLYIRPANYGEEHRIDVSVQDWFGKDSICDPNYDQGDNGKLIKYETNEYSIYWVAYANLEARTMTIYMKSSHTEDFGFVPDEGLQGQIDANHIEVSVEGGASLATVPTELSYKTGEGDKKVVFPTGDSGSGNLLKSVNTFPETAEYGDVVSKAELIQLKVGSWSSYPTSTGAINNTLTYNSIWTKGGLLAAFEWFGNHPRLMFTENGTITYTDNQYEEVFAEVHPGEDVTYTYTGHTDARTYDLRVDWTEEGKVKVSGPNIAIEQTFADPISEDYLYGLYEYVHYGVWAKIIDNTVGDNKLLEIGYEYFPENKGNLPIASVNSNNTIYTVKYSVEDKAVKVEDTILSEGKEYSFGSSIYAFSILWEKNIIRFTSRYQYPMFNPSSYALNDFWRKVSDDTKADAADVTPDSGIPHWNSQGIIDGKAMNISSYSLQINNSSYSNNMYYYGYTSSPVPRIYAPTAAGVSGQVLVSGGDNVAPSWTSMIKSVRITEDEYEALATKDNNTLYLIVDE